MAYVLEASFRKLAPMATDVKGQEQLARPLSQVCSTVDVVVSSYILYCSIFAVL